MRAGYIIVGAIWAACTIGLLAAGVIESVAAAALAGLIASVVLALPVALIAAGLWRSTRAAANAVRTRRGRHQPHRGVR